MATTARTKEKEAVLNTEHLAPYFEKISERHAQVAVALKEGYERTQRVNGEFVDALIAGQRELLELTKQIVTHPQDYASNVKAVVDATTVAQERALNLAKSLFREQTELSGEFRKAYESACALTGPFGDASRKILNLWTKQ